MPANVENLEKREKGPSLRADECSSVECEEGTLGGDTYFVVRKGNGKDEEPLCFRKVRHSSFKLYCAREAGFGTWHRGTGACRYHGGNAGRPITTGKHAVGARRRLAADIQKYLDGDRNKLLDLDSELAAMRVIFSEFLELFPNPEDETYGTNLYRAQALVGTIGSLVDKITRIEARNTLTANQVIYLRAAVADIFLKYIQDPEVRDRAVKELMFRIGEETLMLEG